MDGWIESLDVIGGWMHGWLNGLWFISLQDDDEISIESDDEFMDARKPYRSK